MFDVPEVLSVHEVPSEEVRMVPLSPTLTNNSVEVVVEPSSLLLLQEIKMELLGLQEVLEHQTISMELPPETDSS